MRKPRVNDVLDPLHLLLDRLVDVGIAMAMHVHPPGADRVDDRFAVAGKQTHAFPPLDKQRLGGELHLRERLPGVPAMILQQICMR